MALPIAGTSRFSARSSRAASTSVPNSGAPSASFTAVSASMKRAPFASSSISAITVSGTPRLRARSVKRWTSSLHVGRPAATLAPGPTRRTKSPPRYFSRSSFSAGSSFASSPWFAFAGGTRSMIHANRTGRQSRGSGQRPSEAGSCRAHAARSPVPAARRSSASVLLQPPHRRLPRACEGLCVTANLHAVPLVTRGLPRVELVSVSRPPCPESTPARLEFTRPPIALLGTFPSSPPREPLLPRQSPWRASSCQSPRRASVALAPPDLQEPRRVGDGERGGGLGSSDLTPPRPRNSCSGVSLCQRGGRGPRRRARWRGGRGRR